MFQEKMKEKRWKEKRLGKKKEYKSGNPQTANFFSFLFYSPPTFSLSPRPVPQRRQEEEARASTEREGERDRELEKGDSNKHGRRDVFPRSVI